MQYNAKQNKANTIQTIQYKQYKQYKQYNTNKIFLILINSSFPIFPMEAFWDSYGALVLKAFLWTPVADGAPSLTSAEALAEGDPQFRNRQQGLFQGSLILESWRSFAQVAIPAQGAGG